MRRRLVWAMASALSASTAVRAAPVESAASQSSDKVVSDLPPWREPGDLPLPAWARSAIVERDEQAIQSAPQGSAPRRGTTIRGARLPFYGAKRGPGCAARWIAIGPLAWICQDAVRLDAGLSELSPTADDAPDGLPFHYFFVGSAGTDGYYRLDDAGDVAPDQKLEAGFAIAETDEAVKGGERYVRTSRNTWVPRRDLVAAPVFDFRGAEIAAGSTLNMAWVVEDKVAVLAAPRGKPDPARAMPRFTQVEVLEEKADKDGGYLRIGDGQWLRARDVRAPVLSAPPAGVAPNERWIDVDLSRQTLVAYEGDRPVFATLVSTGIGKEGTDTGTPRGEFRIWVKLKSSDMDNLDDEHADRYYAVEQVPYVQYFAKGVGLHGAFWHRSFGHVRSHGCVNLAPLDAEWLFAFTSPGLPHGWTAVLPTDDGTLVRVR
jgi:hypothetical protein